MRILIVDDELVSRNKMNVLLKPFGECTTIGNGVLAIRLFKDALEKNQPFQLVTLDVEMPGMLGTEVLARFRDMEAPYMQYNPEMMAKVLMVTSHSDYETVSTAIARCNGYIVKPFNNESIHAALKKLGLMDEEGTEIAAAVPREPSVLSPLERFSKLLESGMDLEEQEFQSLMNQMAEEIGQEAEKKLIQQLDAATKGSPLLIRILGAMGSQPRQAYLEPLKRLIERSPHYQLRKEAILVLAKKGDDSVLQALTYLQEKVNNSSLQTIIVSEISAIKQNKPYLGIMPLFLEGQKDPKTHKNIVNTLKKIIKPEDVVAFTAYLDKDDPVVRLGAFELLCERGSEAEGPAIVSFVGKEIDKSVKWTESGEDPMIQVLQRLVRYASTYPQAIVSLSHDFQYLYSKKKDPALLASLLRLLRLSSEDQFAEFVLKHYHQSEGQMEILLPEMALNERSMKLLFQEFENGVPHRKLILQALLKAPAAADYFTSRMPDMDPATLMQILQNVPVETFQFYSREIQTLLHREDPRIREEAMERIRDFCDFSSAPLLCDPTLSNKFWDTTPNYFATVARIFPLFALQLFFSRETPAEMSLTAVQGQMDIVNRLMEFEPILKIPEEQHRLFMDFVRNQLSLRSNSKNIELLKTIQKLRSLDTSSLAIFQDGLRTYHQQREKHLTQDESQLIKECRDQFAANSVELKNLEDGFKEIQIWLDLPVIHLEALDKIISQQTLAFVLKRREIAQKISDLNKAASDPSTDILGKLVQRYPQWDSYWRNQCADKRYFCLHFKQRGLFALFQDQFQQLLPEFSLGEQRVPERQDILIADFESFQKLVSQQNPQCARIYVFLNNPSEFTAIKQFKPVTFPTPISLYRIMRSVLQDLFT